MNLDQLILVTERKISQLSSLINSFEESYSMKSPDQEKILFDILAETYTVILFSGIALEKYHSKLNETDTHFISGFRFLYNTIKHETNPFDLTFLNFEKSAFIGYGAIGKARLGLGPAVEWGKLPLNNSRFNNQFNNYNSFLKSQEVLKTFENILRILKTKD